MTLLNQETNRLKKNQAFTCRLDADRLRTEAGTHCIQVLPGIGYPALASSWNTTIMCPMSSPTPH